MKRKKWTKMGYVSGAISTMLLMIAVLAPFIANPGSNDDGFFPVVKFGPEAVDTMHVLSDPNADHWMGTDYVGRDVFARLVHGIKNSIFFSIAVVAGCLVIGMFLGGIMGFFGGWIDLILSRFLEVVANFPMFLLQLTILAFLPQSYTILFLVMVLPGWIPYCRFIRAEFFKLRNQEFVQAAQVVGVSSWRLFLKHLFPNSLTPIITYIPFDISMTITALGALSFLGFGEPIHIASLGELLKQAREHFLHAWWLAAYPGGVLFMLTLSLALFGSSLRDVLDPRN